jgi:hypothetical protein
MRLTKSYISYSRGADAAAGAPDWAIQAGSVLAYRPGSSRVWTMAHCATDFSAISSAASSPCSMTATITRLSGSSIIFMLPVTERSFG